MEWSRRSLTPQVRNANVQLKPGDIFSIDPRAIPMLRPPPAGKAGQEEASAEDVVEEAAVEEVAPEVEASAEASAEGAEVKEGESAESSPKKAFKEVKAERKAAADKPTTFFHLPDYASPNIFVPAYILPSYLTCSAVYVRHPTARPGYSEIPTPFDADGPLQSLSWEWFQAVAPRMKPKRRARLMNPQRTQDRRP